MDQNRNRNLYIIYGSLFAIFLVMLFFFIKHDHYWYDETFSIILSRHSWIDVWKLDTIDVHPPMFYYLIKVYALFFGDGIYALRVFTALPLVLSFVAAATYMRKMWGNKVAIWFIVLMMLSPNLNFLAYEVRMYSWSFFLVLMTYLYAYRSYDKVGKYSTALFFISSIVAGYLHYYALIAVFGVYLFYFVALLCTKQKKRIPKLLGLGALFALLYAPWLGAMFFQIGSVQEEYWIAPVKFKSLLHYVHPVSLYDYDNYLPLYRQIKYILLAPLLILVVIAIVSTKTEQGKKMLRNAYVSLGVFFFPIVIGYVFSLISKPVLFDRYLLCFLPLYFLALAQFYSLCDFTKKINIVLLSLLMFTLIHTSIHVWFVRFEEDKRFDYLHEQYAKFIGDNDNKNTIFLYRDSLYMPMGVYTIEYPNARHISRIDSVSHHTQMLQIVPNVEKINSYRDLDTMTFDKVFVVDHYWTELTVMTNPYDSLEATQYFDIVKKLSCRGKFRKNTIYELKWKGHPVDSETMDSIVKHKRDSLAILYPPELKKKKK